MTHLDLFTGIGGFHLAAEWAGFQTIGFSEIDPYCCKLLSQKWPEIKNYGDLRTANFTDLRGRISVLSGGVPCQPASHAGKRRGAADNRWLWPATLDVVEAVRPVWCIFENPNGVLSLDAFEAVLIRLAYCGYDVGIYSVCAESCGADHLRYRAFIVAHSEGQRMEGNGAVRIKEPGTSGQTVLSGCDSPGTLPDFRLTESPILRATDGVSDRVHRIKALGNSVVPQQAFPFFAAIAQTEKLITTSNAITPAV